MLEFVASFGAWISAERLHLSAVMTIWSRWPMNFAGAMGAERQRLHDRIHSYAIWGKSSSSLLNVLAFPAHGGLQARAIILRHDFDQLWPALSAMPAQRLDRHPRPACSGYFFNNRGGELLALRLCSGPLTPPTGAGHSAGAGAACAAYGRLPPRSLCGPGLSLAATIVCSAALAVVYWAR